jgi:hypothetical protein
MPHAPCRLRVGVGYGACMRSRPDRPASLISAGSRPNGWAARVPLVIAIAEQICNQAKPALPPFQSGGIERDTAKIWRWPLAVWFVHRLPTRPGSSCRPYPGLQRSLQCCREQLPAYLSGPGMGGDMGGARGRDVPRSPAWPTHPFARAATVPPFVYLRRDRRRIPGWRGTRLGGLAWAPPRCRMSDFHCLGSSRTTSSQRSRQGKCLNDAVDRTRQWSCEANHERTPTSHARHPSMSVP